MIEPMPLAPEQLHQLLVKAGVVDDNQFSQVSDFAAKSDISLEEALIQKGVIADQDLGKLCAGFLQVPFVDLSTVDIPEEVLMVVPQQLARKYSVVAFARDQQGLKIATPNVSDTLIPELVAKKTGERVFTFYATARDVKNIVRHYKRDLQRMFDRLLKESMIFSPDGVEDPPIEEMVDLLLETAYYQESSDIHIEPQEKNSLVRFRIDGMLHDVLTLPTTLHDRIVTRIKIMSGLRTDEHMSAQDGKMQMGLREEDLDLRVSIIPIANGEKVVLRLLSSKMRAFSLSDLGMDAQDLAKVTQAFNKSHGMILCTGPTGCGKTTTIYSVLKILNVREKNITAIEDPTEYRIAGANQIQVNTKTDLTFAKGLRSILRQDPDIIFVGEIRDSETAGIAVNAAMTGHLVLSTLHTNDAATAIPRLIDMKVEPFLVASTVNVIVAQRLVRKVCDQCREAYTIPREELTKFFPAAAVNQYFPNPQPIIHRGKGCKVCHQTGYSGRIGIFEILQVTKAIRELVTARKDADVITQAARQEGMKMMYEDGLQKVAQGMTTFDEVLRVTTTEAL